MSEWWKYMGLYSRAIRGEQTRRRAPWRASRAWHGWVSKFLSGRERSEPAHAGRLPPSSKRFFAAKFSSGGQSTRSRPPRNPKSSTHTEPSSVPKSIQPATSSRILQLICSHGRVLLLRSTKFETYSFTWDKIYWSEKLTYNKPHIPYFQAVTGFQMSIDLKWENLKF